jgi:hypothetical protein
MHVLVLVLSFDREPWASIEREQRRTWAAPDRLTSQSPVHFYYGVHGGPAHWAFRATGKALRSAGFPSAQRRVLGFDGAITARRPVTQCGDRIHTRVPESYLNVNAKTWAAVRYLLAVQQFDYLFRTNTSSYVSLSHLRQLVDGLPRSGYYGGFIGHHQEVPFASGTGILLSRDAAEFAFNDPSWEFDQIDDVALGRLMARAGVSVQPLPRINVTSPDDVVVSDPAAFSSCHLVLCKSGADHPMDIEIMTQVHKIYQSLNQA